MSYEPVASNETVVRKVSALLFADLKPVCVDLLQLSTATPLDTSKVNWTLTELCGRLQAHRLLYTDDPYQISSNLADYIFVPLSNLFKHDSLDGQIVFSTLKIICFLWKHSWSYDHDPEFIDQCYALVLFLAGCRKSACEIGSKLTDFKSEAVSAVSVIVSSLPIGYFQDKLHPRRMLFLGDSVTLLLSVVSSSSGSHEDIKVVVTALSELSNIVRTFMSSEQVSQVIPGVSSQLIAFAVTSRSTQCCISVMRVLRECICKSFNDEELGVAVSVPSRKNLDNIPHAQPTAQKPHEISVSLNSNSTFQTEDWLRATSKQLKLALLPFFKHLASPLFQTKIANSVALQDEIVLFFKRIMKICFTSLFNDFASVAIDVYALLIATVGSSDQIRGEVLMAELVEVVSHNYGAIKDSREKSRLTLELVELKLNHLLHDNFRLAVFSTNEEKMQSFFVAVTFQLLVLHSISCALFLGTDVYGNLRGRFLRLLASHLAELVEFYNTKPANKPLGPQLGQLLHETPDTDSNKLDEIELPPQINAKQVAKFNAKPQISASSYSKSLLLVANRLGQDGGLAEMRSDDGPRMFSRVISSKVELLIKRCIGQLSQIDTGPQSTISEFESLLENDYNSDCRAVALWIANITLERFAQDPKFDIEDFLVLDDDDHSGGIDANKQEILYLIMNRSQDVLSDTIDRHNHSVSASSSSLSYVAAIQSMGKISNCMPLAEFQQDFMIEYLYPLLEALTLSGSPTIQAQASETLQTVVNNYYDGSVKQLLLDNLDYLIDSISLRLLVPSNLTPSVLGILVILIKVAGAQLLASNQINDVIAEMFIVIDLFHGYSQLVESFFFVFEELLTQIQRSYPIAKQISQHEDTSPYSPWGLASTSQLAALIDDSARVFEPLEDYDSSREYFTRKPDTPFKDQMPDSDDEDDDEPASSEEVWTCIVPQQTYLLAQRIFNYGFLMLQQLSNSLKVQVLKTLRQCYPILCENYKLVPLTIAQNWLVLLALMSGKSTLSEFTQGQLQSENVIQAAVRLALVIVEEDSGHREQFLSRRFNELCEFLFANARAFKPPPAVTSKIPSARSSAVEHTGMYADPKTSALYVEYILAGLSAYGRAIPDTCKYQMVDACIKLGIPKNAVLSQDAQNIRYVILHGKKALQC